MKLVQARPAKTLITLELIVTPVFCGARILTNCGFHVVMIYIRFLHDVIVAINFENKQT